MFICGTSKLNIKTNVNKMSSIRISGIELKNQILEEIEKEVQSLEQKPGLAVVLVGDDPASHLYVGNKEKACKQVGFTSKIVKLESTSTKQQVIDAIEELNADDTIHGIICQLPLPDNLSEFEREIIEHISPAKDADGLTIHSAGKLLFDQPGLKPCTPSGIIQIFNRVGINPEGLFTVIVGRSNLVGKPLANLLLQRHCNATVVVCHSRTSNLTYFTKMADILIVAIGRPEFITPDQVKEGAILIDVGINRINDPSRKSGYRFVGDISREAYKKSSYYTPVPGGVGCLTVAMLLNNTLQAYKCTN